MGCCVIILLSESWFEPTPCHHYEKKMDKVID